MHHPTPMPYQQFSPRQSLLGSPLESKPKLSTSPPANATLTRNGLTIECFYNQDGKLHKKREHYGNDSTEFIYHFDPKGHLLKAFRNNKLVEEYAYNELGQRVRAQREYRGCYDRGKGRLEYDKQGKLFKAGEYSFSYNKQGALAERRDRWDTTRFSYGKDTLLDKVHLSYGGKIWYEYDPVHRIVPAKRFRNELLVAEYVWRNALQLAAYLDHEHQLEYTFLYDTNDVLDRVRIVRMPYHKVWKPGPHIDVVAASRDWPYVMSAQRTMRSMHLLFEKYGDVLDLHCCTDQVGTLKLLTDRQGRPVKEIQRDSFGVILRDSFPDLYMPIGFAGGLQDPDTGLVHFGYRDYDPVVGRFTAPDPLGDTGGDHDLYDYCIDDPVTMNDPTGLFPPLLLYAGLAAAAGLAGKAAALGLGRGGAYGAAKAADKLEGKGGTKAQDGVKAVVPTVARASLISAAASPLPAAVVAPPGAAAAAGRTAADAGLRAMARVQASRYGDKIVTGATHAARLGEGYANPNWVTPSSVAGGAGAIVKQFVDYLERRKNSKK
ncbi:MAG: RHS repeat-associated core domain-containing protein [Desulfovibrionaceae bacterium]|nr:RHS repeat-associated core domain-containing protein [Desulfovibrionaceae bacterium]